MLRWKKQTLFPLSELNSLIYPNQGPALDNWGPGAVLFLLQIQVLEGSLSNSAVEAHSLRAITLGKWILRRRNGPRSRCSQTSLKPAARQDSSCLGNHRRRSLGVTVCGVSKSQIQLSRHTQLLFQNQCSWPLNLCGARGTSSSGS